MSLSQLMWSTKERLVNQVVNEFGLWGVLLWKLDEWEVVLAVWTLEYRCERFGLIDHAIVPAFHGLSMVKKAGFILDISCLTLLSTIWYGLMLCKMHYFAHRWLLAKHIAFTFLLVYDGYSRHLHYFSSSLWRFGLPEYSLDVRVLYLKDFWCKYTSY